MNKILIIFCFLQVVPCNAVVLQTMQERPTKNKPLTEQEKKQKEHEENRHDRHDHGDHNNQSDFGNAGIG
jgi:ABC-type Zn2+ transport system substrate-binding protein/surface adhesin